MTTQPLLALASNRDDGWTFVLGKVPSWFLDLKLSVRGLTCECIILQDLEECDNATKYEVLLQHCQLFKVRAILRQPFKSGFQVENKWNYIKVHIEEHTIDCIKNKMILPGHALEIQIKTQAFLSTNVCFAVHLHAHVLSPLPRSAKQASENSPSSSFQLLCVCSLWHRRTKHVN